MGCKVLYNPDLWDVKHFPIPPLSLIHRNCNQQECKVNHENFCKGRKGINREAKKKNLGFTAANLNGCPARPTVRPTRHRPGRL